MNGPESVAVLFVGESPPASGRNFYHRDSGLYRAMREVFQQIDPSITDSNFLTVFQESGCHLVDLCPEPVDNLPAIARKQACRQAEPNLALAIQRFQPSTIVTLLRSIQGNVNAAIVASAWRGLIVHLPYPGRWRHHRDTFVHGLVPVIRLLLSGHPTTMKLLTISGSLRAASSNTALLRAAAALAPSEIEVVPFDSIGNLPHFNPDLDGESVSPFVTDFRTALRTADAVVFSVPEYAHGVPGVVKNALDWVVGSGELVDKPVVFFNSSARGTYAQASILETLTVMAAHLVPAATVTLPSRGQAISAELILQDAEMSAQLRNALETLVRFVQTYRSTARTPSQTQTYSESSPSSASPAEPTPD